MAVKSKKMLSPTPAKSSVLEKLFGVTNADEKNTTAVKNPPITSEIPIYNIRWYPSNKSCVKISAHHRKVQNTPPLMVRKAEWRR